ncbi:GGDEF domain-containing protein [Propionivibrio sp.]|uniref:GGDEF domain-containing protein n=1 Tax=Propionivibrio sp. TaxID=2212460 RepID=UPI0039E60A5A
MLPLLRSIESISSCRDRGKLPAVFLGAVEALFGGEVEAGIFSRVRDPQGGKALRLCAGTGSDLPDAVWTDLACQARPDGSLLSSREAGLHCGAMALESSELCGGQLVLVFGIRRPLVDVQADAIETLARIFGNQVRLIDYSELDSLTRLLNRKTFDETFDRLLTASSVSSCDFWRHERRLHEEEYPAWLGVIDIDHFKRINDSFGHLFGDEVLLRMGDLLRKTFRDGDRLFRFGGEEFVVILNAPDRELAEAGFERFRSSVEKHEFPQVGKVTCSIGFTAVSKRDVPTDAVGRADEALYCAKRFGRNWVCCYEQLLAQGVIVASEPLAAKIAENFDIDALFG